MKSIYLKCIIFLNFLFISNLSFAFEPTWHIDFGSIFDNREGDGKYNQAKTYFFTSLSPELGLKFTDKDRIAGGIVWNQPLENGVKNGKVAPTLYYRHEGEKWNFSMGIFPMTQLFDPLPGFLWCDSLAYFQKNLRGALAQYSNDGNFMEAYIDWRGMQSETTREAFNILFHGQANLSKNSFFFGGYIMMNHLAKTIPAHDDQYVIDNFLINPYIGTDFPGKTFLDSILIKAGTLLTVERDRKDRKWRSPGGFWMEILGEWKFLGLRNSLYMGGKLFSLYGTFGNLLYQGEAFYSSTFYDRLDIYAKIYHNKYLELQAQLNFNFTKDSFIFYQRLILNISLGGLLSSNHK